MLSRTALRTARSSALRAAKSTVATPTTAAPVAVSAATSAPDVMAVSRGELAWCEVYGVDYEKQVRDAQKDSPIALNDPNSRMEDAKVNQQNQDIWSVVFGTHSA
ncbi:hypothetical protein Poli38472_009446 [Pythium oligandrum]|uniref:Uncharacterized protein n=1 Tax=Pythium oligandrum TaxID=41045 RepID=A0A8K1CF95_PYTOL|nr:hypothetical protein Poli38472_009446 [Pythium oligandrum]|eukprot:TMW61953.1 hypothetical protein Poli38472_009446 [Pythium oligandrum]